MNATSAIFSVFPTLFSLIFMSFMALGVFLTVFWIWMIFDCVKNEPSTGNDKVVWLLLLIFTHWIGALIYFFVRKAPRQRLMGELPQIPRD